MDIQKAGRQAALALMNVDDVVLVREVSDGGLSLLSLAGRSLVGGAVAGAGIATRAAVLGAQVATKSARAVAGAARGRIPGAGAAEQMCYDLDQRIGRSGEAASYLALQGVEIAKTDRRPPAEPIFGDPWLGKRLKPGATPNTVLFDSALDLTRIAAMPLTVGTNALTTPAGQQVTRAFWEAVSSIVDAVAPGSSDRLSTAADRSERRAALVLVAMMPLVAAAQDIVAFGGALARGTAADADALRSLFSSAVARMDASRVALQSAMSGALDVDAIESWVRADEASRSKGGPGLSHTCPASVRQLETLVAEFSRNEAEARRRGFVLPGTIEVARDTIFSYSTRALGREAALARMERLFGAAVRDRLADDCSLRGEFLDAKRDRDARLAALVSQLQHEGDGRLRQAREHAAARLAWLTASSADRMFERLIPQRIADRAAVLRRFIAMAHVANALDGIVSQEPSRQNVMARFSEWMSAPAAASDRHAGSPLSA
ncbi:MAG: hypothetical protein WEB50_08145 [Vicinamibacterales bacterium]